MNPQKNDPTERSDQESSRSENRSETGTRTQTLNALEALRFLEHEARFCHDRDEHEAFCLLVPPLVKALGLQAMDDWEALDFRVRLRSLLNKPSDNPRES